jgi:hypothetical protein
MSSQSFELVLRPENRQNKDLAKWAVRKNEPGGKRPFDFFGFRLPIALRRTRCGGGIVYDQFRKPEDEVREP